MQLQDANTFVVVLVGVVIVAGIIVALLFAFRKTSAMSDELSKEAEARLKALRPQPLRSSPEGSAKDIEYSQSTRGGRLEPAGNNTIMNLELKDTKRQLDQLAHTITPLKENVSLIRKDAEETKTKLYTLESRTNTNSQEIQKLRMSAEQLNVKLLGLTKDIARQREEYAALLKRTQQEARNKPQPQTLPVMEPAPTPERRPSTSAAGRETSKSGILSSIFSRRQGTCAYCGRRIGVNDRFCDSCGKTVAERQQHT